MRTLRCTQPILALNPIRMVHKTHYPKSISSFVVNPHTGKRGGYLTKQGMDNFEGYHNEFYEPFLLDLKPK
jgi:hypothetical protein